MLILWLALVILAGGSMIFALVRTQGVNGDMWRDKAGSREHIRRVEPARRGTIYSSDGKVLATTVPVCDLCLDLGRWPKKDMQGRVVTKNGEVVLESCITNDSAFKANLPKVCQILHTQFPQKSLEHYRSVIMNEYSKSRPKRCLVVQHRVPYSQWEAIRNLPGWERCVVSKTSEGSVMSYVRAHIYGNLGENTIGLHYRFDNKEGYTGLEGYYDTVLRGCDGIYECRRLTRGVWVEVPGGSQLDEDSVLMKERKDGKSIIATIDTRYQDIAENALRKSMNQYGGQRGCAILMEVKTGYVLACSNLTRDTSFGLSEHLWNNVAVSDRYEPGSTFKVVAMTAMLNDRKISLDTSKRVRAGGVKQYSKGSGNINDGHGYATDTCSLPGVLAKSSNVGMCELAWEYYRNRRNDFKENVYNVFPFGRLHPDVEVQEPGTKIVDLTPDRDFLNLSYGYSATVTPLQMATFYNAIANNGCMVKPLFCREILDGRKRTEVKPIVLKDHICSEETAKQMREMLVGVVKNGTGNIIYTDAYSIAGKTGTALGYNDQDTKNSSFAGFFPADNPRYTIMVLVEGTSIAGRMAAAPVFKQIADCVMAFDKELGSAHLLDSGRVEHPIVAKGNRQLLAGAYSILGLPFSIIDSVQKPTGWAVFDSQNDCYKNYAVPQGVVPDCSGMTIRDAMKLLRSVGLQVKFRGQGKVASQSPKARTQVKKGAVVTLELKP